MLRWNRKIWCKSQRKCVFWAHIVSHNDCAGAQNPCVLQTVQVIMVKPGRSSNCPQNLNELWGCHEPRWSMKTMPKARSLKRRYKKDQKEMENQGSTISHFPNVYAKSFGWLILEVPGGGKSVQFNCQSPLPRLTQAWKPAAIVDRKIGRRQLAQNSTPKIWGDHKLELCLQGGSDFRVKSMVPRFQRLPFSFWSNTGTLSTLQSAEAQNLERQKSPDSSHDYNIIITYYNRWQFNWFNCETLRD